MHRKIKPGMGRVKRLGGFNASTIKATRHTFGGLQRAVSQPSLVVRHQRALSGSSPLEMVTSCVSAWIMSIGDTIFTCTSALSNRCMSIEV